MNLQQCFSKAPPPPEVAALSSIPVGPNASKLTRYINIAHRTIPPGVDVERHLLKLTFCRFSSFISCTTVFWFFFKPSFTPDYGNFFFPPSLSKGWEPTHLNSLNGRFH